MVLKRATAAVIVLLMAAAVAAAPQDEPAVGTGGVGTSAVGRGRSVLEPARRTGLLPPQRAARCIRPVPPAWRYQAALDSGLELHGGVGATAAVIVAGRVPWIGASGTRDGVLPATPSMVFGIASITKVFVAAVVLQLAEEGVVGLDDPVEAWLAPLPNVDGSATVRQLLNHTSGVFDFADHPAYVASISSDPTRRWTAEQTIADFVLGPYAEPGVVFRYSSTGYLLLGMIIERATGSTVSAELRSRVLDPLGLANTFFAPDEAIEGVLAEPWADFDGNGVLDNIAFVPRDSGDSTLRSSGNMYSTALDVARFLRSLMEGEVLEQSSLAEMLDLRPASASFSYGLGIQGIHEFVDGTTGIGHDGGTYGYSTRMIGLPNQRVYIALLMNHSSASPADDYDTIQAISRSLAAAALGIEPDDGSPTFESERAGRRR